VDKSDDADESFLYTIFAAAVMDQHIHICHSVCDLCAAAANQETSVSLVICRKKADGCHDTGYLKV
jgi:hypothetical protein